MIEKEKVCTFAHVLCDVVLSKSTMLFLPFRSITLMAVERMKLAGYGGP